MLECVCTALCSQTCAPSSSCTTSQLDLSQLCSKGIRLQLIQGAEGCANSDRACLSVRAGTQPAGGLEQPEQVPPPTPQPMSREALHHILQPVPALEWRDEEPHSRKTVLSAQSTGKDPLSIHHTEHSHTCSLAALNMGSWMSVYIRRRALYPPGMLSRLLKARSWFRIISCIMAGLRANSIV